MMPPMHENDASLADAQHAARSANPAARASAKTRTAFCWDNLAQTIKKQAQALGFTGVGIAPANLPEQTRERLAHWLARGRHGGMDYMARHAGLRGDPKALLPGTLTVISLRLPYWPQPYIQTETHPPSVDSPANAGENDRGEKLGGHANAHPASSKSACISRYARGRDYHKVVRTRLQKLADFIADTLRHEAPDQPFIYRVFSDSAPVMETEFAQRAGVGWRGKHTLTVTRTGSWHFLGELYTNLPLPADPPAADHCGDCRRCLDACPTGAITAPYELDARRCISYLTIELSGAIPPELRPLIGNRIYGCDDCQAVCPWNRFAQQGDPAFAARTGLNQAPLAALFAWTREVFETRLAGSPIRRIGHERWLRNIAVAIGNAPLDPNLQAALHSRQNDPSPLVREHVAWALAEQQRKTSEIANIGDAKDAEDSGDYAYRTDLSG